MNFNDVANNVVRDEDGNYLGNVFGERGFWIFVAVVEWRPDGTAVTSQSLDEYETAQEAVNALREFAKLNRRGDAK